MTGEEARIRAVYAGRRPGDPRYSWFRHAYVLANHERERHALAQLARHGFSSLDTARVLEVGCGNGYWLREYIKWGARPEHVTGIDLISERVTEARTLCPAGVTILSANAAELPLASGAFDLVLQSTVFSSILDAGMKQKVASEMLRVLKRNGLILWYDFHVDNPANRDVRGVTRREIQRLFPQCHIELQRITLAPPITRAVARYSWLACEVLGRIPWLCTHYLGVIRKPGFQA